MTQECATQCDSGIFINKTHSWSKGYIGKLYLDQAWLAQYTADWKLSITFCNEVKEFKVHDKIINTLLDILLPEVWSADIIIPVTNKKYVNNVSSVDISNMCWNYIFYACQNHEISFLVRCVLSSEFSQIYFHL